MTGDGCAREPGMTILNLPAEQADTAPRELWEGEAEGWPKPRPSAGVRRTGSGTCPSP